MAAILAAAILVATMAPSPVEARARSAHAGHRRAVVAPAVSPRPRLAPEAPAWAATRAPNAIALDMRTGDAIFRKAADRAIAPASLTKLMTLYMVFEALAQGELSLDRKFRVGERAASAPGSSMRLRRGERVRVEDLIRGVIVDSGNDAAITLAEGLARSESAFAQAMTKRAGALGLSSARFLNATGLPRPGHRISVADLATLAARLIADFPERYHYFSERRLTWGGVAQWNRNPLLGRVPGVDGMKTGYTQEAGYCVVLSAERRERRIVVVLAGLESEDDRAEEAALAVDQAFDRLGLRRAAGRR